MVVKLWSRWLSQNYSCGCSTTHLLVVPQSITWLSHNPPRGCGWANRIFMVVVVWLPMNGCVVANGWLCGCQWMVVLFNIGIIMIVREDFHYSIDSNLLWLCGWLCIVVQLLACGCCCQAEIPAGLLLVIKSFLLQTISRLQSVVVVHNCNRIFELVIFLKENNIAHLSSQSSLLHIKETSV